MKRRLPVIPAMKCDDGCGECCGVVPVTEAEYETIATYVASHDIKPREQGLTCPFWQDGRCAVYDVRPLLCKLFGHTPGMTCSHGHNVNMRERDVRRMLKDAYNSENEPRVLHEMVPSYGAKAAQRRALTVVGMP
jgi:Fe-S-cluster containining protein